MLRPGGFGAFCSEALERFPPPRHPGYNARHEYDHRNPGSGLRGNSGVVGGPGHQSPEKLGEAILGGDYRSASLVFDEPGAGLLD
jgi:hypothetical protein